MCFLEFILILFLLSLLHPAGLPKQIPLTETKPEAVFCFVPTWRFWIYFCRLHTSLWTHLRVFDSVSVCSQVNLSVVRHVSGVESASVVWLRQEQWSPTVSSVAVVSLASSQWRKTWHLSQSVWLPPRPLPPSHSSTSSGLFILPHASSIIWLSVFSSSLCQVCILL